MVVWCALVSAQPAHAQGFLDFLFGGFSKSPPRREPQRPARAPLVSPYGGSDTYGYGGGSDRYSPAPRSGIRRGHYRTVCVRLCDGFYFPINHGVSRAQFYADADACQSRCGSSEARLFFMPAGSSRIEDARDQSGLPYKQLENAFTYRKTYVKNCSCRPKPWSVPELARHEAYQGEEARREAEKRRAAARHAYEEATGMPLTNARELFESDLAEAQPPAPSADWEPPEMGVPVRVATAEPSPGVQPEVRSNVGADVQGEPQATSRVPRRRATVTARSNRAPRRVKKSPGGGWFGGFGAGSPGKLRWPGD